MLSERKSYKILKEVGIRPECSEQVERLVKWRKRCKVTTARWLYARREDRLRQV